MPDFDFNFCAVIDSYLPSSLIPHCLYLENMAEAVAPYVDLDYLSWLLWVFSPVVVAFLLPVLLVIFIYMSAFFLHIYGLRQRLLQAFVIDFWSGARSTVASFWDAHGRIWHGYEVKGLENIPDTGPALIVYYHGTIPLDVYYLISKCVLFKGRTLNCVADKFVFKIPGWKTLCDVFCATPGTAESCVESLKAGNVLCIAPGGVREAMFSDNYEVLWMNRIGFAKIALLTGVPVLPMFTENCRQHFVFFPFFREKFRRIYERTRLPLMPIFGWFPVKLRTHIGQPIIASEGCTPEELRDQVKAAIEDLIQANQRRPGNIFRGIYARVPAGTFRAWFSWGGGAEKSDASESETEVLIQTNEVSTTSG